MNADSYQEQPPNPKEWATIVIADDHSLVREGLKLMLIGMMGQVRFLEAGDAETLLAYTRNHDDITVALVDLNMPGMEKGATLAKIAHENPQIPMVVISALTSPDVIRRTLEIPSVHAFVPKSATTEHVKVAINAATQGIKLMFKQNLEKSMAPPDAGLTPRMEEIRSLLAQGMTNKHIALTLGISEGTVKNYLTEIFKILSVSNRTQAAQYNSSTS